MNFNKINKLLILILFFLISSCDSVDVLNNKKIISKNSNSIEKEGKINIFNELRNTEKYDDFYNIFFEIEWANKPLEKRFTYKSFDRKYSESRPLNKIIYEDQLITLNSNSLLEFYELKDFKKNKSIDLNLEFNKDEYFPTSIARLNNFFYSTYSFGQIISFDIHGKIVWNINFNDIIKTPIKIFNDTIILLLSNKIVSIDAFTGIINWEFVYESENRLKVFGGEIVDINHLLFFILPNNEIGEVDTIFGEKNNSVFTDFNFNESSNSYLNTLHSNRGIISTFNKNKFLTTIDIKNEKILIDKIFFDNVISFSFLNNSLFFLNNKKALQAINILNGNLFWEVNLKKILKNSEKIIKIFSNKLNLIIFFDDGKIIEINPLTGDLVFHTSLKIDKIIQIKNSNNLFIVDQSNGKTSIFSQ